MQAIPLVGSAALGHLLFGDFKLALTASLLLGSLPGVYLGARVSSRAREVVIRPALTLLFLASGLKLLNLPTDRLAVVLAAVVLLALPVWGVLDAAAHSTAAWKAIDANRRAVLAVLGAGAPLGVGFVAALVYFSRIRPRLVAAVPNG